MATNCAEEEEMRSRGHGVSNGTRSLGKSAIALAVHAVFPAARNAPSAAGVLLSSSVLCPCDGLLGVRSRGHPHGHVLYDRRAALCHLLWLQYHQHRWHARLRVHRRRRRRRYQRRRRRLRGRVSSAVDHFDDIRGAGMAHSASQHRQCFHGRSPTATPVGPCAHAALKCVGSCSHSMRISHEPVVTRTADGQGLGWGWRAETRRRGPCASRRGATRAST